MQWAVDPEKLTAPEILRAVYEQGETQDSFGVPCRVDECNGFVGMWHDAGFGVCFRCGSVYRKKAPDG